MEKICKCGHDYHKHPIKGFPLVDAVTYPCIMCCCKKYDECNHPQNQRYDMGDGVMRCWVCGTINPETLVRPPSPAESAMFVKMRQRPFVLIFPPGDGSDRGQVLVDERLSEEGDVAVLAVLEWAEMSWMERGKE